MERRIRRLGVFMLLCFLALFVQLNYIQVVRANSLAGSPGNPAVIAVQRDQPRGRILSSDGIVLAYSVPTTADGLSYRRIYPSNTATLFSQIVGFDSIIYGQSGVEEEYNAFLEKHTRPARSLRDLLVNRNTTDNVTLTIDSGLQLKLAGIVEGVDKDGSAPNVGAVIVNVHTGAIEAMYGNPTYDPNPLASTDINTERLDYGITLDGGAYNGPLVSRAYQYSYLPGSTFKVVTSSAVFDHDPKLAAVDYPVTDCLKDLPQSGGQNLCNYEEPDGSHERCGGTILTTLPASCNTAFAQMGIAMGKEVPSPVYTEAVGFGFNQRIPIDLPYVPDSTVPTAAQLDNNIPLQAYSAFGQGTVTASDSATALQMALVAAGIADKGIIMTPHVMENIRDSQGNLVETYQPKPWLQATTPSTAALVTKLMQLVVTSGTAKDVFPPSWDVAAKTGTAETGGGAQGNTLTNDWMIAFAPANDPQVAAAIVVPNQPGSQTGAGTSGPPMKLMLAAALGLTP
jgi:peptidoglycan glycosyltransferase